MFFCAEHRDVIKKEQPDLKVTEVTSQLGKAWAALDEVRLRGSLRRVAPCTPP